MSSTSKSSQPPATDTRIAQLHRVLEAALIGAPRAPEATALVNGTGGPLAGHSERHLRVLHGGAR